MATSIKNTEELFLKIFKITILLVMGLALTAIFLFIVTAIFQYSQSPKEPAPAQKAPVKYPENEISLDQLSKFLIDQEKIDSNKEDAIKQKTDGHDTSLPFLEQATILYRCTVIFGIKVGAIIEGTQNSVNIQKVEELRKYIESKADGSLRGEAWVRAAVAFTCMALSDNSIIALRKEAKVKSVFLPVLNFHIDAWDRIQTEKVQFEQREENRVASERAAEALRIAEAKALAITCLIVAASAFGLFMILALYLLGAKIENDLRDINESIRVSGYSSVVNELTPVS
jgi:hypothetical protein